ncbi:MAG: hypothetical protein R6V42_00125 [Orrella sp.]
MNLYANRTTPVANDHRIPIVVLHGQPPQCRLLQLLEDLKPNEYSGLVVIAPVTPPEDWPETLRLIQTASDEFSQEDDCLCCALNTEVSAALSRLFFSVLRKQEAPVSQVLVVTASDTVEPMAQALKHAPFLGQRYRLAKRQQ